MENNELYHHGIQGQKWGVRRWQNPDGSLTPDGREHYGYGHRIRKAGSDLVKVIKTKHQAHVELKKKKEAAKVNKKNLEKARKAKEDKKKYEEGKKKALDSGGIEEVLKYKNDMTNDEKNAVIRRLQLDNQLASMANENARIKAENKERNSKWNKAMRGVEKLGKAANSLDTISKLYNSSAKIVNAFTDSKLPIIGEKKEKYTTVNRLSDAIMSKYRNMSTSELLLIDKDEIKREESITKDLEKIMNRASSKH